MKMNDQPAPIEMIINDSIKIWMAYNPMELSMVRSRSLVTPETIDLQVIADNHVRICILNTWYTAIPLYEVARTRAEDGYYRFIYIQINIESGEYYVGKVNRKRWRELYNYPGSGLKFKAKYIKHRENFVRYYIAACNSAKETEELEAHIVNEMLLSDPFCLNLVKGGGGTNNHNNSKEKRLKQKEYMKKHPEQYKAMLEVSKVLYRSGDTQALRDRNSKIKETMSDETYRNMTKDRILNWKERDPDAYLASREKNKASIRTEATRQKKSKSYYEFKNKNPEQYLDNQKKRVAAAHSVEAEKKRSKSLKEFNKNNPDVVRKRMEASNIACRKSVNMLDLETGEVVGTFCSQHEAARWLVDNEYAKNMNCVSSINAVCLKRPCTTGYGIRTKAYGFGWEYTQNK